MARTLPAIRAHSDDVEARTVTITGALPRKKDNPGVPISVHEQVEATLVHLHVRNDDESGSSNPDRFAAVLEGIRWEPKRNQSSSVTKSG